MQKKENAYTGEGILHRIGANIRKALETRRAKYLIMGAVVLFIIIAFYHFNRFIYTHHLVTQAEQHLQEGEFDKASQVLHKAIQLNPDRLDAYLLLARTYMRQEKYSLAVDELLRASNFHPDDQSLHAALQEAYQGEMGAAPRTFRIGVSSELNPLTTVQAMKPLLHYLSQNLDYHINLSVFSRTRSLDQELKEKKIDIAILGPGDFIGFSERNEVIPLFFVSSGEEIVQRSIIVTSGKISSVGDLKGKRFAFGRKDSLTGYIIPRLLLIENGIDPEKDFSEVHFMDSQEDVFQSLREGEVDAGALAEHVFSYLRSTAAPAQSRMHLLARSNEIPADILVVREDIPVELMSKVEHLFRSYSETVGQDRGIFPEYTAVNVTEDNTGEGRVYTITFVRF